MTPWWFKPTAKESSDDGPERDALAEVEGVVEEELVEAVAEERADDEDSDELDLDGGRRRRRRRRPVAQEVGGEESESEAPAQMSEEEPEERPRRARGRSKEADKERDRDKDKDKDRGRERARDKEKERDRDKRESSAEPKSNGRRRTRDKPVAGKARASEETFEGSLEDIEQISREIALVEAGPVPVRSQSVNDERKIALFCDLENIALGVRDSADVNRFDINLVLERLVEKGKIIVKKSYCDWERYSQYKRPFHESAIELIDIPQNYAGKNSADIKMVVDAMDLCYAKEHLDTFVILSGDSDFSPLVSKLKENNKYVIGMGVKNSTSNLLVDNCDEFIYYEDVARDVRKAPKLDGLTKKQAECFSLMVDAIKALMRENKDVLWGSMVKQTIQRKRPSFSEGYYGYSTFSELLEDAERSHIIKLKKDRRSGSYVVTGFGSRK